MAETAERTLKGSETDSLNNQPQRKSRLLALEIRPQKFGFVVFEGPTRLLDWRIKVYQGERTHRRRILAKRIDSLLKMYAPPALVMRRRNRSSRKTDRAILLAVKTIRAQTVSKSTRVKSLDTEEIRAFFARHGCKAKHQIASLIANWFEELSWKLPQVRKPWHSERSSAVIFDAAATGIAFLSQRRRVREQAVLL